MTEFDFAASTYDVDFTETFIGKSQRNLVWSYLSSKISLQNKNVLEINAGSGEDALFLAKKGANVLVSDVSTEMLKIAQSKFKNHNFQSEILFQKIDLKNFEIPEKKFDLIFSNFGGLNCLSNKELELLSNQSQSILTENGKLVLVIMPTFCLWESIYFVSKLKFKNAFRRMSKKAVNANVSGIEIKTYYHSPNAIKSIFKDFFSVSNLKPIGFFIPPSYLQPLLNRFSLLQKPLLKLEKFAFKFSFLAYFSDHYLIELKKI